MRISDWSSDVCSSDLPAPVIVVRDIAAEDWPEDGRHHSRHSPDCEADIRSLLWKDRDQQCRGERDQRAARETLQDSEGHEQSAAVRQRSEEHTSELQSLMRISYDVICLTTKTHKQHHS